MPEYFLDMVKSFVERMDIKVKDADTPWLDLLAITCYKDELEKPGGYGGMASSPLMSDL